MYFANAVRTELQYPFNMAGHLISLALYYWLHAIFFDTIAFISPTLNASNKWIELFLYSYVTVSIGTEVFAASINSFFRSLTRGAADPYLTKPTSLLSLMFFRGAKPSYLIILGVIGVLMFRGQIIYPLDLVAWAGWLAIVALGIAANIFFITALQALSFITQRDLPIEYIHSEISAFAVVPTPFYPEIVSRWLTVALPMLVAASIAANSIEYGYTFTTYAYLTSTVFIGIVSYASIKFLAAHYNSIGG